MNRDERREGMVQPRGRSQAQAIRLNDQGETLLAQLPSFGSLGATSDVETLVGSLDGRGQPLSRDQMEFHSSRFGVDFRSVRIHAGPQSTAMAQALGARAFTLGTNVVLGGGYRSRRSVEDRQLLAHELAHVIQQTEVTQTVQSVADSKQSFVCDLIQRAGQRAVRRRAIQRGILDALRFRLRQALTRSMGAPDPLARIFDEVVSTNILTAARIGVPGSWRQALLSYAAANPMDGAILLGALARLPRFYRGGWIMRLQPAADAMTLDHSIFVPSAVTLSLSTYIHELVHVWQYGIVGTTNFLVSYFGLSAATIAARWLRGEPTNPMQSSPHEDQAYNLEGRFDSWHRGQYGTDPNTMTV